MSQPEHLENVPAEIWREILVNMEPSDVLSVGQTYRSLRRVTRHKDLWRCHKHDLFRPSFPVEEMSLVELQRATVGPYLFARRLQRQGGFHDTPLGDAYYPEPLSNSILGPPKYTWVNQLVPGGRFAILACSESKSSTEPAPPLRLELWDLGPPGSTLSRKPTLILCYPNIGPGPKGDVTVSVSVDSRDPKTLRLVVTVPDRSSPGL
ncbi:hypothetical protein DFP72DRAFT_1057919 [Ephemerocybe angulata]|uniref:F-box domain-containing protein n=1 Tax=Ephemerocybe angulata TaxID=980116 RepID=A0A8H6MHG3_9AGAR|nr:hypothetical protein DFP72DRAFT_1057919 [Tulosesus angulatus]